MAEIYYIEKENWDKVFADLKTRYRVFVPFSLPAAEKKETDYFYRLADKDTPFYDSAYRTNEPLKVFFGYPREVVADYFSKDEYAVSSVIVFGVKACDLYGHKVQDFVFLQGLGEDHLYRLRREHTLFISSDCTSFKQVCHCLAWDTMPYPQEGFDWNMSSLNEGYLVEIGSIRGKDLFSRYQQYFVPARTRQKEAREEKRKKMVDCLSKHLSGQNLVKKEEVKELVNKGYNLQTWKDFMLTCVECGGCNFICDTCHCFLLADISKENNNEYNKIRTWDSCQYANFARVAGGANPLRLRAQRLRNRFLKKFDFFVDNLGMPACCGCGRCIEVCPGKIDIREVLKDLRDRLKEKKEDVSS